MIVKQLHTPGLSINTYIVFDETTGNGAVIDPTVATQEIIAAAAQENILITDILETHVHADFISGAQHLKHALSDAPTIHCSGLGGKEWIPTYADRIVHDGDEVVLGAVRLQAKHTPGHTPEHIVWILYDDKRSAEVPEILFTGDLLFVGSIGRPDLLGNEKEVLLSRQLYCSLFDLTGSLPPHVEMFPAHGSGSPCGKNIGQQASSTLGYEKACNPWLKMEPYETWHTKLMQGVPAIPQYFPLMKRLNVIGPPAYTPRHPIHQVDLHDALELAETHIIIDIRPYEVFSEAHIKGSINIPLMPSFPLWAGSVLSHDRRIILVADTSQACMKAIELLQLIGMDQATAFCDATLWGYPQRPLEPELEEIRLMEPADALKKNEHIAVIDVRSPSEWNEKHLPNAIHMELAALPYAHKTLPKNKMLALICRSGSRASIAASYLRKQGFPHVCIVREGMRNKLLA